MASVLNIFSSVPLVALLLGVPVLCIILSAVVSYRKLSQFNGPFLASFSRWWLFWEETSATLAESQHAALQKYGSPCRIGSNLLVTDDPDLIRHMNAPGSPWRRSGWYDGMRMDPRQDSVFSTRDEKHHADLRAKEAGGYNGRDIASLEPDIDSRVLDMLDLIRTMYNGVPMDFASVSRFFTLDVLSTVAFGRPFGFMAANEDLWDYNKTSAAFVLVLGLTANHSSIRWLLTRDWMQALAAPKVTDKLGLGPALAFANRAVAERFGSDAKPKKDMLGHFVSKGLSQTQCEVEAFLQIIAGSDSTTSVLRSTVFLLAGNPPVYAKLKAEVDNAVNSGAASSPVIKHIETLKLPYLKACIMEGLRLYPPLFGLKGKRAPPGGDTFKGVHYPEGAEVSICDDAVCRQPEIFGEDHDVYRPERFLEGDEDIRNKRLRTVDVVFGSGRFQCLGKHIAMIELHKAVFELFRNFDIAIADPMKGISTIRHTVHIQSDMNLIARPRQ